jgi:hypothetical protein
VWKNCQDQPSGQCPHVAKKNPPCSDTVPFRLDVQLDDDVPVELEIIHTHLRLVVTCLGSTQSAVRMVLPVLQYMPKDQQVLHQQLTKEGRDAHVR